jgi:hypothetical protein
MTDLLERVIDKGVMVRLDLVVGVAGIPLVGISLHAAVAAIETMLRHGMLNAWDAQTRASGDAETGWRQRLALEPGEQVRLELYGSCRRVDGIWRVWRPGRLLLTDQRLLLVRPLPEEVLFTAQVDSITGLGRVQHDTAGGRRDVLCLALEDGTLAALYTPEADVLEACLKERFQRLGRTVTELSASALGPREYAAVAAGQLWHHWRPGDGREQWKSGWAVLTADELIWQADVGPDADLRVPLRQIRHLDVEERELARLGSCEVLVVSYGTQRRPAEALFTGENVGDWPTAILRAGRREDEEDNARP